MTAEQLQKEFQYRVAMALIQEMLGKGIISDAEYSVLNDKMIVHFRSVLIGLSPENA